jgi:two-component system response regulator
LRFSPHLSVKYWAKVSKMTGTDMIKKMVRKNKKYVLLVEDNPDDVALTQAAFKKCGISNPMIVVWDGQEALDFIFAQGKYASRDSSDMPAVMLLDLKLPLVSGSEVLKQIRLNTRTCRMPTVVLSSSVNMQEIDECEKLGINRYFRKPSTFEQLVKIIEEIRSSWLDKLLPG